MNFFKKILDKLGIKKEEKPAAATASAPVAPKPTSSVAAVAKPAAPIAAAAKPAAAQSEALSNRELAKESAPAPISEADVVAKLEGMAAGSGLNWKSSIVDFLKVLGLDASKEARIELAKELGCPAELIGGDYSKMNLWLHKEVLKQIANNGGNIPKELLD